MRAAVNLLERARALPFADERSWLELAPDLGFALRHVGSFERGESVLSEAIERARIIGEPLVESHAWLVRAELRQYRPPEQLDVAATLVEAEKTLAVFQETDDDLALARAYSVLWELYQCTGDASSLREAAEQALAHARRAGSRIDEAMSLTRLGYALLDGPTPVSAGVTILERLLRELRSDPLGEATVGMLYASLIAMQGRFDDARDLIATSRAEMQELGTLTAIVELMSGRVEMLAGDRKAAERATRAGAEHSAATADNRAFVLALVDLARALCEQDDPAECLRILDESQRHPAPPDWEILVKRPAARALALARLGSLGEAETLAREAVGYAEGTEFLDYHADALLVLAEVLRLADRPDEAAAAVADALALSGRKGNLVLAERARARLEQLR